MKLLCYLSSINAFSSDTDYTHTSIGTKDLKACKFTIPIEKQTEFLTYYKGALKSREHLSIVERHNENKSPILIDLDLRYQVNKRSFSTSMILDFIETYCNILYEYICIEKTTEVYVLQKPLRKHKNDANVWKDGIHIIIPNIVTSPKVQEIVREDFLLRHPSFFDSWSSTSGHEVFDKAVIKTNGWFMYGSMKPDEEHPWLVSMRVDVDNNCRTTEHAIDNPLHTQYVDLFLIHTNHQEASYTEKGYIDLVRPLTPSGSVEPSLYTSVSAMSARRPVMPLDLEIVEGLANILSATRAATYDSWMRVGWCLYNISPELLYVWEEFSKKSSKYKEGECESLWGRMSFSANGINFGSLKLWAKTDNPDLYKEIITRDVKRLIYASKLKCEVDIADVAFALLHERLVCITDKVWYVCDDNTNRWVLHEDNDYISRELSTTIYQQFIEASKGLYQHSQTVENVSTREQLEDTAIKLKEISHDLRRNAFKNRVINECFVAFRNSSFQEILDSDPYSIVFTNGILDLKTKVLRPIQPTDYVSKCVNCQYVEWATIQASYELRASVEWMMDFFRKAYPREEVRDWKLQTFAQSLCGKQYTQAFFNEIGGGGNSKSVTFKFLAHAFGTYAVIINAVAFTGVHEHNRGDPFIAQLYKARLVIASEAPENAVYNTALIKTLTGGDVFQVRLMYSNKIININPSFMLYLLCNLVAKFNGADGGFRRRHTVTKYESRFVDNADDDYSNNVFAIDTDIDSKLRNITHIFMSYLVHIFNNNFKYIKPDAVAEWSRVIGNDNDPYHTFFETKIDKCTDGYINLVMIKMAFKEFLRKEDDFTHIKCSANAIKEAAIARLGDIRPRHHTKDGYKRNVFVGYKLIDEYDMDEVDLLEC